MLRESESRAKKGSGLASACMGAACPGSRLLGSPRRLRVAERRKLAASVIRSRWTSYYAVKRTVALSMRRRIGQNSPRTSTPRSSESLVRAPMPTPLVPLFPATSLKQSGNSNCLLVPGRGRGSGPPRARPPNQSALLLRVNRVRLQ